MRLLEPPEELLAAFVVGFCVLAWVAGWVCACVAGWVAGLLEDCDVLLFDDPEYPDEPEPPDELAPDVFPPDDCDPDCPSLLFWPVLQFANPLFLSVLALYYS